MGKLEVNLVSDKIDINKPSYEFQQEAKKQHLEIMYNVANMNEIELDGEDFILNINIDQIQDSIDWKNFKYPNIKVKGKVLAIVDYKNISAQLKKIIENIDSCRFENRYELDRLGNKVIDIIKEMKESPFIKIKFLAKDVNIGDISHSIKNEVKSLLNIKHSESIRTKNEYLYNAKKHLISDIESFKYWIEHYNVND